MVPRLLPLESTTTRPPTIAYIDEGPRVIGSVVPKSDPTSRTDIR